MATDSPFVRVRYFFSTQPICNTYAYFIFTAKHRFHGTLNVLHSIEMLVTNVWPKLSKSTNTLFFRLFTEYEVFRPFRNIHIKYNTMEIIAYCKPKWTWSLVYSSSKSLFPTSFFILEFKSKKLLKTE